MDPVKTGTLIRTLRTRLGLTQRELAERLTVSDRTISKWERGLGCPDISLLAPLAAALGVSTESLLTADLTENPPQGGNMKNTVLYLSGMRESDLFRLAGRCPVLRTHPGTPEAPEGRGTPASAHRTGGGRMVYHHRPPHDQD